MRTGQFRVAGRYRRIAAVAAVSLALVATAAPTSLAEESVAPTPEATASASTEATATPTPVADPSPTAVTTDPVKPVAPAIEQEPPTAEPPVVAPPCVVTAASVTFKASGYATNLWGTTQDCAAGTIVAEAKVGSSWVRVGTATTSGAGGYAIPLSGQTDIAGTYELRAVLNGTSSNITAFQRLAVPTVASANQKLVGKTTYTWGRFDTDRSLEVWTEVLIGGSWARSQTRSTTASGDFTIPLTYGSTSPGTYRWRVAARYPEGSVLHTKEFTLRRLAQPTVASAGTKPIGQTTYTWGRFDGGAGIKVWTEVYVSGSWALSQVRQADANGYYSVPLTYGANVAGNYRFRVAGRYPDGTVARSKEFTLTRTNPALNLDRRCLTGRVMCASKTTNTMHWMIDGRIIETVEVRFGRVGMETREGQFQVGWKSRYHVSSIYGTPMPWAMFFSGGQAVHYSADFMSNGYVGGSAGCINVRDAVKLDRIYNQVRVGDKVVVYW